jgi:MFS family permease
VTPVVAGGFVGLLSIFNMAGRFIWSSASDFTGRKAIYCVYFLLGCALYLLIPVSQHSGSVALFVVVTCLIISMYGGGFATIPAYLRDLFGTAQVGAIHGRVITSWSAAAVLGPQLITYLSAYERSQGVPKAETYNTSLHIMGGFLVVGHLATLPGAAAAPRHHYSHAQNVPA